MRDFLIVFEKEFSDLIRSKRLLCIVIVYILFYLAGIAIVISAEQIPRNPFIFALSSLTSSLAFLAPAIGIALGFDAISGEYEKGTLRVVLAQPIFRDSLILGKFLAAFTTISLAISASTAIVSSAAVIFLGFTITTDEVVKIILIVLFSILLSMVYYSLAVFISVLIKKSSHSAIISISLLVIFLLILPLIANLVAFAILGRPPRIRMITGPLSPQKKKAMREAFEKIRKYWEEFGRIKERVLVFSPNHHFSKIVATIIRSEIQGLNTDALLGALISRNLTSLVLLITVTIVTLFATFMIFVKSELK